MQTSEHYIIKQINNKRKTVWKQNNGRKVKESTEENKRRIKNALRLVNITHFHIFFFFGLFFFLFFILLLELFSLNFYVIEVDDGRNENKRCASSKLGISVQLLGLGWYL